MAAKSVKDDGKEKFTFFWRSESPFSQWHPSEFKTDGRHHFLLL